MQLTPTFRSLLLQFRSVFTAPTFATFVTIATGWSLSFRHRYVTELIQSAGAVHRGHHSRYHRFFSNAAWSIDDLYEALARDAIRTFFPEGTIELGVDDTLCRRRGLTIFGTGMHHDPLNSSRNRPHVSWGHDWVILSLLISNPPWSPTKVWALPVGMRLYRNRQGLTKGKAGQSQAKNRGKNGKKRPADPHHRTRPELAVELIGQFAVRFPERKMVVSGDSAYGGKSVLQHLPANVDLISRVASNAALYEPAPRPQPKQKGPPRKKGFRLPAMAEWAADETKPYEVLEFDRYGLHAKLQVKTISALYYKAGKDRLLVRLSEITTGAASSTEPSACTSSSDRIAPGPSSSTIASGHGTRAPARHNRTPHAAATPTRRAPAAPSARASPFFPRRASCTRNHVAINDNAWWWCQPDQVRTWLSASPASLLPRCRHRSTRCSALATRASTPGSVSGGASDR
jgi:hypothetical protein